MSFDVSDDVPYISVVFVAIVQIRDVVSVKNSVDCVEEIEHECGYPWFVVI